MNVQFAIQSGVIYILEVNPRASRTVPFVSKATGIALAKVAARVMTGKTLAEQGQTTRAHSAVFLGQGSGVPVHQVPRGRSHPRAGDEIHRRGHGHRQYLRRGLCQGAGRLGRDPADPRPVLHQRARPRQAGRGAARADAHRARLRDRRHRRHRPGAGRGGNRLPAGQQSARGSPARRRYDKKRRDCPDRQYHGGQASGARVAFDSPRGGGAARSPTTPPWPARARRAMRSIIWAISRSTGCRICTRNWRETNTHDSARRRAAASGVEAAEERGAAERHQGDRRGTRSRRSVARTPNTMPRASSKASSRDASTTSRTACRMRKSST